MSKVLYYYAKINENNICYGFETLAKKLRQEEAPSNLIPLPDYNETVLWRKWDRETQAWSAERYEPSIDTILQDKVEQLETENVGLKTEISNLQTTITNLNITNETLVRSIAELTAMIAMLQTPAE